MTEPYVVLQECLNEAEEEHDIDMHDCRYFMHQQTWGSTACGFGGMGGSAITTAPTVVVQDAVGHSVVFHNGKFAYKISHVNDKFHEDLRDRNLMGKANYEGQYDKEHDFNEPADTNTS